MQMKRLVHAVFLLLPVAALSLAVSRNLEQGLVHEGRHKSIALGSGGSSSGRSVAAVHKFTVNETVNSTGTGRQQQGQPGHNTSVVLPHGEGLANATTRSLLRRNSSKPQEQRWHAGKPTAADDGDKPLVVADMGMAQRFFRASASIDQPSIDGVTPTKKERASNTVEKAAPEMKMGNGKLTVTWPVFWALVLAFVALGVYILCIPIILTLAKRRPRPAFSG